MARTATYRVSEAQGDPAQAAPFAAAFFGAAALTAIAGFAYVSGWGGFGQMCALAVAMLFAFVGFSFVTLLRRNVLFAYAHEEEGLLLRMGHRGRARVPWSDVLKVVRSRKRADDRDATLHLLVRPRRHYILAPGPGLDELYSLMSSVLDGKRIPSRAKPRPAPAEPEGGRVYARLNGYGVLLWALVKMSGVVAGGVILFLASDRDEPLEQALFAAIAFLVAAPLGLFPPSGSAGVVRASAGPKGLAYQSILFGTRRITWDRLALARVTVTGALGSVTVRMLEFFDVDGGRLLMGVPRNPEFVAYVDKALGSDLGDQLAYTRGRPRRQPPRKRGKR